MLNVLLYQATKAHREFIYRPTSALDGGGWSTPRPYTLYRRLGGPWDRSGQVRKNSTPPSFEPPTVLPKASVYTDYAIPANKMMANILDPVPLYVTINAKMKKERENSP